MGTDQSLTRYSSIVLGFVLFAIASGCDQVDSGSKNPSEVSPPRPIARWDSDAKPADRVRIASFNIQVLGPQKVSDSVAVEALARIIRNFDVVAIQEIRTTDPQVIGQLLDQVNAQGDQYGYVVGPRLGRSHSKEQYAFIFDQRRIEVATNWVYTVSDPGDRLHREPLVARFRSRAVPTEQAFTFTLVNIHTDPDEVDWELNQLDEVLAGVERDGSQEDDVMMLGDFNAGPQRFEPWKFQRDIDWAIRDQATNTRRTRALDNLIFNRSRTVEYTGNSGVFDFQREFGLTLEESLRISDHLPIWAEFSAYENQPGSLMARREPA